MHQCKLRLIHQWAFLLILRRTILKSFCLLLYFKLLRLPDSSSPLLAQIETFETEKIFFGILMHPSRASSAFLISSFLHPHSCSFSLTVQYLTGHLQALLALMHQPRRSHGLPKCVEEVKTKQNNQYQSQAILQPCVRPGLLPVGQAAQSTHRLLGPDNKVFFSSGRFKRHLGILKAYQQSLRPVRAWRLGSEIAWNVNTKWKQWNQ